MASERQALRPVPRSGNRTLRVSFCDELTREQQAPLAAQEANGSLEYETCGERVPGSFDDRPDEDAEEGGVWRSLNRGLP
jgi:hypothetical protein